MKYLFIFLLFPLFATAQIDRVEPPFWWQGMKNKKLKVLLYGDDLSKYDTIKGGGKYTVIQKELTDRGETALANTHMTYVNAAIAEDWPGIVGARTAMYLT